MNSTMIRLSVLLTPVLVVACAATAPVMTEFPAGARGRLRRPS